MSKSSLWTIEELLDYQRKYNSELPPLYDFEQVRPIHRDIEAAILEYWELLHPLIQDYVTSWWQLWSKVQKEDEELTIEFNQKSSMLTNYKNNSEAKIKNLVNQIKINKAKLTRDKEDIEQKEVKLQEMEELDKEKQLGIANLRVHLEKELAELNLKLSEMQTRFEATQSQVLQSFEHKQMVFESEVASLKEKAASQAEKIQSLQAENDTLKSQTEELTPLEEKIWEINEKLRGLSFTDTKE